MLDAARLAVGTLTVVPVPAPSRVDRATWGAAICLAPLVGLLLGSAAWVTAWIVLEASDSPFTASVALVSVVALLTRGLHVDGLADVADGLGSRRPPEQARAVMRQSDIGPFGVMTVVLVLLGQIAALSVLLAASSTAATAVVVIGSTVSSRVAVMVACRMRVPAASDGLGAGVVGSVSVGRAIAVAAVATLTLVGVGALLGATWAASLGAGAIASLVAAELWWRHCAKRLGAVTGDVLGSVEQLSWTAFLVVLALLA